MCAAKSLRKAKSRLPLWGRCHARGMTERVARQRPAHSCPRAEDEKVVKYFKKLGNMRVLFYTRGGKVLTRW